MILKRIVGEQGAEVGTTQKPVKEALLLLDDREVSAESAAAWEQLSPGGFACFTLSCGLPPLDRVEMLSEEISAEAREELGLKRVSIVARGAASSLALCLSARWKRMLRKCIIIEPAVAESSLLRDRILRRIEAKLPLGLPLRRTGEDFDLGQSLHRIHCPALVFGCGESERVAELSSGIPNAWFQRCSADSFAVGLAPSEQMQPLLEEFFAVPVKRPQKGPQKDRG